MGDIGQSQGAGGVLAAAPSRGALTSGYAWYVLILLSVVSLFAYMDRYLLAVLLVPIQKDIGASDTAMGLLIGVAFFTVYATAAIPLARLADRTNRRNIIAIAVAIWSLATCFCGLAVNYLQLALARVGVALGEAAAGPTAFSLVGDLFRPSRRALAAGVLFAGTAVGIAFGAFIAGVLNEHFGWRTAFVVVGLAGLPLSLILWLTVVEPIRGAQDSGAKASVSSESFIGALRYLFGIRTFVILIFANAMQHFGVQGSMVWMPTFLMRAHEMSTVQMGLSFGLSIGAGMFVANLLGGFLGDRLSRFGSRWYLFSAGAAVLCGAPVLLVFLFTSSRDVAVAMIPIFAFVTTLAIPATFATNIGILPARLRGLGAASMAFIGNALGSALAPVAIGAVTDALTPRFGANALGYALACGPLALVVAALLYLWATRSVERDTAAVSPLPAARA